MTERLLPLTLLQRCGSMVRAHHKSHGRRGLTALLAQRRHMTALMSMPDTLTLALESNRMWAARKVLWAVVLIALCLTVIHTRLWLILGALALGLECLLARRMASRDMYFASTLLGMEWLTHDFAGWGTAFPDARASSFRLLGDNPSVPRADWLDYYLPNRAAIPADVLARLGQFPEHA